MYNDLFSIGPFTVHGYGLMIAIGVLAALFMGEARAKKRNMNADVLYPMTFLCAVFGFLCAKILFCIVEFKELLANPMRVLSSSGFVVYGGIIGGVLVAYLYCRYKKLDFGAYFDLVLPSVALAQAFGRIGCFLAGCCYGRETDSCLGITFTNSDFAPNGVRLIPTQLISSAGMFLITGILLWYARKERRKGKVGALYLILYSIGRFLVEFLRSDYRGEVGIFSTSQFISLFVLAAGILLFFGKWPQKKEKERDMEKIEGAEEGKEDET